MKRLFIDMDGCIARFYAKENCLEEMYEKNFFRTLDPYKRMISALLKFSSLHSDVEFCILSAYPHSPFAKEEKEEWLNEFFPVEKRIFMEAGQNKSSFIPDISKNDFLLDDHTKNLLEWEEAGGTGIKVKNELNCKRGTWKGNKVDGFDSVEEIVGELEKILGVKRK